MPTKEVALDIRKFTGLNIRDDMNAIADSELVECLNYDLGRQGELVKRPGFKSVSDILGNGQVLILGYYQVGNTNRFIVKVGDNLYYSSDAISWTPFSIPNNLTWGGVSTQTWDELATATWGSKGFGTVEYGVQYAGKFYIVRSDAPILEWDGTDTVEITGSPKGSFCKVFRERLFVINTYATGNESSRLHYSKPGDFSSTGWESTGFIDIQPGDGDFITCIGHARFHLLVYKSKSIWIVDVGDNPLTWGVRNLHPEIGCVSKWTLAEYEGLQFFLGSEGLYATDGTTTRAVSDSIEPAFRQQLVAPGYINQSSGGIWQDRYILLIETYPTLATWGVLANRTWNSVRRVTWQGSDAIYSHFVYHIKSKGWTRWRANSLTPHTFLPVLISATLKGLYCGDKFNGRVHKFGLEQYTDNDLNYECVAETKEFDFEDPTEVKRGKWVGVKQVGVGSHSFTNVVNNESRTTQTILGQANKQAYKIRGPGYFRSWRIRSSITHENYVALFGFTLHTHKQRTLMRSGT